MQTNTIINIAIVIVLIYSIIQLLNFYGVGANVYGSYFAFYLFLFLCTYVLPNDYPSL